MTRGTPRPFSEKQIELVTTFADQAVIAIENVRLFEEVQARTARAAGIARVPDRDSDVLNVISRSTFELQAGARDASCNRPPSSARRTLRIDLRGTKDSVYYRAARLRLSDRNSSSRDDTHPDRARRRQQ